MGTGVRERGQTGARERPAASPRFRLLLHNDDVNTMDHVVVTLARVVPGLTVEQAARVMMEAHTTGVALVLVCVLERAELYRDGLVSGGLTATIEPE